jgi:antitoxin component YwqK of YwqJK toxin-antitoxin module
LEHIVQRVRDDELTEEPDLTYTLDGAPFSGTVFDTFPNGRVWSELEFVNGHQEGAIREWYENGQLKSEGMHLGEGIHGPGKEWHANGQVKSEWVGELGILIEAKEWDEQGRLIREFRLEPTDPAHEFLIAKRKAAAFADARDA